MVKMIKLLRIREAAEILGVNPETLRRWDRLGKLKAVVVSTRGDRRYRREDIVNFINIHQKNKYE
ncbi:MerR family transcriptional regulator [Candidatus Daviesbacteria bacterium]|nr:MerR family transcriptional regulator [Candidatus Daviesbacteria bacterium]